MSRSRSKNEALPRWIVGVAYVLALACSTWGHTLLAASELVGRVTLGAVPIPGATVTATLGSTRVTTVTAADGTYRLSLVDQGVWTLRVEMPGFRSASHQVTMRGDGAAADVELALLPVEEFRLGAVMLPVSASVILLASDAPTTEEAADPDPTDSLLITGSVHNSAASPFAQLRAFGNNRPRPSSLYNGGVGLLGGTSAWDARPYSFSASEGHTASYTDLHFFGTLGGPLKIPGMSGRRPTFFLSVQRTADTNASTQTALVPTVHEREGDLSTTAGSLQLRDPLTGHAFPGNAIPRDRISPEAAALLRYYPVPNVEGNAGYNYEYPLVSNVRHGAMLARLTQPVNRENQLFGSLSYHRTSTETVGLFQLTGLAERSEVDAAANWTHRLSPSRSLRVRYQFTRLAESTTPHFAHRVNVSGAAGIRGNSQTPANWGPPSLSFAGGLAGLTDAPPMAAWNRAHSASLEVQGRHHRHNFTYGVEGRRHRIDLRGEYDPRGTFAFAGDVTGSDIGDFLLGIPSTSSITFGNNAVELRGTSYAVYVADDWRAAPNLTLNVGVRWEYESPLTEHQNRLVNLELAPGFTAAHAVSAASRKSSITGARRPRSLMHPDWGGIQPRLGVSWKPKPGSSLLVRGGYGIYRDSGVYQPIAAQLTQQPPLSLAFTAENSTLTPLSLADGFIAPASGIRNTFAVDPHFKVGYAHRWEVAVQRDLTASLTTTVAYRGSRGNHQPLAFLPNSYPPGGENPCPECPGGFVYLTSTGRSAQHSGQVAVRRRLRHGLSASVQYTLSRAVDDVATFAGGRLAPSSIAQDWRNLEAESAPSAFDQRHRVEAQFEWTTGVGVAAGGLLDGWRGKLLKGWTFTGELIAGSGLPLTPVVMRPLPGTGITGLMRAEARTDAGPVPSGHHVNPAAYAVPEPGAWGSARRNSITGPKQSLLNAGVTRTFAIGNRLSLDWRVDASNVLNRVTFAGVQMNVGSPQFGIPNHTNPMRRLRTSLRLRF